MVQFELYGFEHFADVQYQNLDGSYSLDIKIMMVHYCVYKATFDTTHVVTSFLLVKMEVYDHQDIFSRG